MSSTVSRRVQGLAQWGPFFPALPPAKTSRRRLILAVGLLALEIFALTAGVGAYMDAKSAAFSLQITCRGYSDNVPWFVLDPHFPGYLQHGSDDVLGTMQIRYLIYNPSAVGVVSNWTLQVAWKGATVSDHQAFSSPSRNSQLVTFHFAITLRTAIAIYTSLGPDAVLTREDSAYGFMFTNRISNSSLATRSSYGSNSTFTNAQPSC